MYVVIVKKTKENYNSTIINGFNHRNLYFWFYLLKYKLKGYEVTYTKE